MLAIISDIHSNLPALEEVLKEIKGMEIVCCGDLVGYNPYPNEVIKIVKKLKIATILGNHDYATITGDTSWFNPIAADAIHWTRKELEKDNMEFLRTLPQTHEEDFFMIHGSPRNPLEEYVYPDYPDEVLRSFFTFTKKEVMILGHTHVPFSRKIGDRLILNPGGVGQPRDGDPRASYALLNTKTMEVEIRRMEYNIDKVAKEILKAGLPEFLAYRLYKGR